MAKILPFKKLKPLCAACKNIREDPRRTPLHVVHPVTTELLIYNARGEAQCPTCGALWRRNHEGIKLVEG